MSPVIEERRIPSDSLPKGARVIAVTYGLAAIITGSFWILGLLSDRLPSPAKAPTLPEAATAATTRGFLIADLVLALPLLLLSAIGIWLRRSWGWVVTYMVNILWCYSLTVVFIRDIYSTFSPGLVLFSPFVPFAIWSSIYLWQERRSFNIDSNAV